MKCDWITKKLSEIAIINPRESLGKGVVAKKVPMDKLQPFCRDIPEFVLEEYKGGTKFRKDDTIMARITPCLENGKIAKVSVLSDGEVGFGSTEYIVFRAIDGVSDADFLYYLICSPLVRNPAIKSMVGSSGRQRVQTDVVTSLNIELPPIEEQRKIGGLLKSLDDKIELNNQINNNLEQQMQALFNEYLSSNKFYDLTTVKDVVLSANTGADAIQKAPIVDYDTGIRCIRVGDMTNNRSFHDWGFTKVTDDVFKRYQLHKDDIVVTRTASLGLNTIISKDLPAVYNNGLIRLTVNTSNVLPLYLFRQFQTEDFSNYISCIESETSVRPNMKINYLLKYEFVLPPITKQNEIIALLTPMLNQQNNLIVENKHLEALRDTLLPKLMSGELDVSKIKI